MGQQEIVRLVEGRDVRVAGERDEPGGGDLLGRPLGLGVHFVRVAAQMRHGTRHAVRSSETRPSSAADRQAVSSAAGSFFSSVHVRSGSGKR